MSKEININHKKIQRILDNEVYQDFLKGEQSDDENTHEGYPLELILFIRKAVGKLPEPHLTIINLYFWQSLSCAEISQLLKISIEKVNEAKAEAISSLRRIYLEEFSRNKKNLSFNNVSNFN